jgi:chitosanase
MSVQPSEFIRRVLSVAETDREQWDASSVFTYADDNRFSPPRKQVTLSIGFTEGGGNLLKVLQRYYEIDGGLKDRLRTYHPGMGRKDLPSLANNNEFIKLLKLAGNDPKMRIAQNEMFEILYMAPAIEWATKYGFQLPLSFLVVADSFLHSGSMLDFLMNSFPDKKPSAGGDEKKWINAYLNARLQWLKQHSNKVLRTTIYRVECFIRAGKNDNWDLTKPVVMNGTTIKPLV